MYCKPSRIPSRRLGLLIAFSAIVGSSAGWAAPASDTAPQLNAKKLNAKTQTKQASNKRISHAVEKSSAKKNDKPSIVKAAHREVVALAPAEAEVNGWRVQVASAEPVVSTADMRTLTAPAEEGNMNVYGMLAAALGLGAMSIVRRMGRM